MSVQIAVYPARPPVDDGWEQHQIPPGSQADDYPVEAWQLNDLCVISAIELSDRAMGPEYHLSITILGRRRPYDEMCQLVLRAFGIPDAIEDRTKPGPGRHYYRPVANSVPPP